MLKNIKDNDVVSATLLVQIYDRCTQGALERYYYKGTALNIVRKIIGLDSEDVAELDESGEKFHKTVKKLVKYLSKINGDGCDLIMDITMTRCSDGVTETVFTEIEEPDGKDVILVTE